MVKPAILRFLTLARNRINPTTQTIVAHETPVARTSAATYDFYTGAVLTTTDVDNGVTNATEYDDLGRPTKAITAQGTALESWTTTEYDDVNRRVVVRSDLETVGDGRKVATQFFDQLGRVRLAKTLEDPLTQSPYNETDGIKVQTRYKVAAGYTYQLSSNPYRAATSSAETDPTMGWTLATGWSNGKRSEVQTFSGSALPTVFGGGNTNSTGIVRTDIDAERTLVTDQAGKQRLSKTNALGQLKEVWEILPASETGSEIITFPNTSISHGFKTTYNYDTLSNLTTVNQGSQQRDFTYSSLSRLLTAANPESGTIQYGYDTNGNLTTKTDARSITTTYAYDALNRVTQRSYSDATPAVSYFYDNLTNAKGKLTKVTSSVSTTEYTAFDILGRVTGHKQTTDGQEYATAYLYNLSGAMVEQAYPSGRVVKNVLDANGGLSMVQSKKNAAAGFWNYAENFTYNPAGAVTSMQLGNGRWESTQFNSRLQPTQIALGATPNATNLLKLDYSYGTTANNGNVLSQTITVPTVGLSTGFTAVQNYTYDSVNRLKSAVENVTPHGGSATQSWKQTYTFDRYGNRRFDFANGNTTFPDPNCPEAICNPTISTSNNRLTSTGWSYDNAGNTTNDPQGRTFTYDAENKQTEVRDQYNTVIGQYFYNGDGQRVKKIIPASGETTIFVYNAEGSMVAEYSTNVASMEDARVAYLTHDHLNSPRILTDRDGSVISRRDFRPFGDPIIRDGYGDDTIRKHFATYERDTESELDFAQARYYSSSLGRFFSVDPENAGAFAENPQTWNAYAYVGNNPVNITDPDGLSWYFNSSIGEAGHYKWYDDDETPAEGYRLVNGAANHVYYAGEGVGYVALNPLANKFQTFDTRDAALNRVDDIYSCPACQGLANSIAENADTKSRVVISAAAVGGAVGVCLGTAGAGCVVAKEGAEAIIQLQLGASIDLGTMRNRSAKVRTTKGNTTIYDRRGGTNQANTDFNNMNPTQVKDIQTPYGPGRTGKLPSGETVTVRPGSSGPNGVPTIEIRRNNRKTDEFRYR